MKLMRVEAAAEHHEAAAARTIVLTLDQKRDFIGRAFAFLEEAAGDGLSVSGLQSNCDPDHILMDMTKALGLEDWPDARAALLEQLA